MSHTKGHLRYHARLSGSENHRGFYVTDSDRRIIAEVMPIDADGIEGEKLARLIASAPQLLEDRDKYKAQRDRLLEALEMYELYANEVAEHGETPVSRTLMRSARIQARAAIAAAKEGK